MSEFQCYKFKTIDRPLTGSERHEVNALSSRGHVTSNSATFIYHYSDFRHKPEMVLEKYFDAMLYFTNWGTRRLMFRLPAKLADGDAIEKYCYPDKWGGTYIHLKHRGECYILDMSFNDEEGGEWMEEDDFDLDDLTPLRDDILNGNYGALYLLWAQFAQAAGDDGDDDFDEEVDDDPNLTPPPVPPGLKKMTGALKAFTGFFEIDEDLVSAAQSASPDKDDVSFDHEKLLRQLPENERIEWLARLLKGETRLDILLKKRLEQFAPAAAISKEKTVSPAELRALANQKETERKAREAAAAQAAHIGKMQKLAGQEEIHWKSVAFNLERKTGKSYDLATETLKDLRALAEYQGKTGAFQQKMLELKEKYGRSWALVKRWEAAGLFR